MIDDPLYCAVTAKVLDIASKTFCKLECDYALCGKVAVMVVDLWLGSGSWPDTTGRRALIRSLDNAICEILSGNSITTAFALCEFSRHESNRVITECIQSEVNTHCKRNQILLTLIDKDPTSYSHAILRFLRMSEGSISSRFDNLLVAINLSHLERGEDKDLLVSWQQKCLERSASFTANAKDIGLCYRIFEQLSTIPKDAIDLSSLFSPLSSFIKTMRSSSKTSNIPPATLVDVTLRICLLECGESTQEVASHTFLLLSEQTARLLRNYLHKLNPDTDTVDSRILETIESSIILLTSSIDFDLHYLKNGGKETLTNVVKVCLRLSLRPMKEEVDHLSARCLKLVESCVTAINSKRLSQMFSSPDDFTALVFEMASTHSNFHDLMRSESNEFARNGLIMLLLVCLQSCENITFDKEVWQSLLYTFDGGMSPVDLMLRKVIRLYGKLEEEVSQQMDCIFLSFRFRL